jgi:hypothetical protein
LFGLGRADVKIKDMKADLADNDKWTMQGDVQANVSVEGFKFKSKTKNYEHRTGSYEYIDDVDVDGYGLSGFGLAFDLGAEYKWDENWSFSAALLDLGYIGWKTNYVASTDGDREIHTSKYIFNVDDDASNSFENESDRFVEGLSELYELQDKGNKGSRSRGLAATMNLGVEYTPDFYRKMSFGLTNSTRMGKYGWTEFRLSTNVAPTNIFSASANVALCTYCFSFGWLLNFHPTGFNMYLGMDHTLSKLAKQGLPLSGRGNVNIGINIPFGNNKTKKTIQAN